MTRRPVEGTPADYARALTRLALDVERIRAHVTDLDARVARATDDVAGTGRAVTDLADGLRAVTTSRALSSDSGAEVVPCWMTITDPQAAVLLLDRLTVWVRAVWGHYDPHLAGCWPWHPALVADLEAVRVAHEAAHAEGAPILDVTAWHDRWAPGLQRRTKAALTACGKNTGVHVNGSGRFLYDPAVLDELAAHWATRHDAATLPGLTRHDDRRSAAA